MSFSVVRKSFRKAKASGVFAHTPRLALPPLSPERVAKTRPRGILIIFPAGSGGIAIAFAAGTGAAGSGKTESTSTTLSSIMTFC